jgi:hypothetical protein
LVVYGSSTSMPRESRMTRYLISFEDGATTVPDARAVVPGLDV